MRVSIIIPAHNEEAYLPRTLEALRRQTWPAFEIIVVANGCSDQTAAIAQHGCHRLIVEAEKGLSRARNLGAKAARGELLVFLDADTLLEPGALAILSRKFTRGHAGTLKGIPDGDRPFCHLIYFAKNSMHRWSLHEGSSGVIICWKKDFEATGGFNESLHAMEISHLIKRLRSFGDYAYIGETAATTSMRRYEKGRARRAVALWIKLWLHSVFGDLRNKAYEAIR